MKKEWLTEEDAENILTEVTMYIVSMQGNKVYEYFREKGYLNKVDYANWSPAENKIDFILYDNRGQYKYSLATMQLKVDRAFLEYDYYCGYIEEWYSPSMYDRGLEYKDVVKRLCEAVENDLYDLLRELSYEKPEVFTKAEDEVEETAEDEE